ncbi:hypothetical protein CLOSTASPAR_01949 [[Clostridium] asparagiforme DSM 15981]|uniref:Uncharacterized protein n=1 Tax=[Clostridium] asparagiforme DSM 15981 TaxID=518636 RepID=C0CY74_9FIRM|nr:hypothetical protein CLOSTASPAR_01949 [[Clostridium] asparagiforme DSM 15981]
MCLSFLHLGLIRFLVECDGARECYRVHIELLSVYQIWREVAILIGRLTRFLIGEAGFKQIKKRRRACG